MLALYLWTYDCLSFDTGAIKIKVNLSVLICSTIHSALITSYFDNEGLSGINYISLLVNKQNNITFGNI